MTIYSPGPQLTFNTVPTQQTEFKHLLQAAESKIVIDLSNTTGCDSAGLAFLIESRKQSISQGVTLEIIAIPEQIQAMALFCGVEKMLAN